MNGKILKEIFHGIVSLVILAFITYLYFTNFFNTPLRLGIENLNLENRQPITGYFSYINSNSSPNISCQFKPPTEKTIIIRMDDVQAWTWNEIVPNLTDTVLSRNMSITLGVIPKNIDKNPVIKNYLIGKITDSRIEIAQHGTNHSKYEFMNLSELEAYDLAKTGLEKITSTLGIYPITFIPPHNVYDKNTTTALSRLGFLLVSAKQDEYKFDGNVLYIGYTIATKHSGETELTPVNKIINSCKDSLELKNTCVVLIHPFDYANEDKSTLNETRYNEFIKLLDGIRELNVKFINFKDLIECD